MYCFRWNSLTCESVIEKFPLFLFSSVLTISIVIIRSLASHVPDSLPGSRFPLFAILSCAVRNSLFYWKAIFNYQIRLIAVAIMFETRQKSDRSWPKQWSLSSQKKFSLHEHWLESGIGRECKWAYKSKIFPWSFLYERSRWTVYTYYGYDGRREVMAWTSCPIWIDYIVYANNYLYVIEFIPVIYRLSKFLS